MRHQGFCGLRLSGRRLARAGLFFLPLATCFALTFLCAAPGQAQIPNLSMEQLQQLQQMQQFSRNPGDSGAGAQNNAPMVLQPAVPDVPKLTTSRLEQIMSARAGVVLEQFGYDQLGRASSVTIPQTGAIQDDYILGPGDEIVVLLRGQERNQENAESRVLVDRNGQVVLPRLPPIAASGRSLGSFRADLEAAVQRAYVATTASVSVARMRQISVTVTGEVNRPGTRLLTGLSSAVDALLLSGGVKKSGSLRSIRIVRAGRSYTIDLYSLITDRPGSANFRLTDGDRISVPLLGATVAVSGLVRRPGIYELPPRASSMPASQLLVMAGGQEVRGAYRLSLLRVMPDGRSDLANLSDEATPVHDSEILMVQFKADQVAGRATLAGGVALAGTYPVTDGTKLSEILKSPGAMGATPYSLFGMIVRKDPSTHIRSLIPITPVAVMAGHEDMLLQGDDIVRIFSQSEAQLLAFITQSYLNRITAAQEALRNPTTQITPNTGNAVFASLANQNQSVAMDANFSVPADIQRNEILALLYVGAPGSALSYEQSEGARMQARQQAAAQSGRFGAAGSVGATNGANEVINGGPGGAQSQAGAARAPSAEPSQRQNPMADPGQAASPPEPALNYVEQADRYGEYPLNREVATFGELSRQLAIDPLVLVNFLVEHRASVDGAILGPGSYLIGMSVQLRDLVTAAGGTVNWANETGVELISTTVDGNRAVTRRDVLPLRTGNLASYIVKPRDQFRFPQVFSDVGLGSVSIQGEVRHAGLYPIIRGERLSDLLARAGGLTNTAYPYGTVYLRQSAARLEREGYIRAAGEIENQLITALGRVGNDKLDPGAFTAIQSFVTELRNQKALGRVAFSADPSVLAAGSSNDPLLEAGDVIYIPQRPGSIALMGEVRQPGSYPYQSNLSVSDYLERAGGFTSTADTSQAYIVLPDGSARRIERSWLRFGTVDKLPPGSAIVVPRDIAPLDLRQTIIDISQIVSQLAISLASLAVLSR